MATGLSKTQLIVQLAETAEVDKNTVSKILNALTEVVHDEIGNGGSVTLPGIVKVACRERGERMVRNPATGESLLRPADRRVTATVLKGLKSVV
ncbi:HU family DNA-binding protein [Pseudogemmobacter faecipullorum]|uniref:Viral histone-like protein n=1 Tax=Pseudogemmobacter faecipullorum TaxID=2755041 RepID=A0ABS8CQJ9_9RHOB|nr:HU family DNA-binding protein [Pseudogemmobacter faecipullorum]MCB5411682.1 HU family DNA-binding protein [Pseudogemmobacter faecipullorum]